MWTLAYNDETKTLAEWGISGILRRQLSLAVSSISFDLSADIDAEDVFAYGSTVTIFRDDLQWFVGRVDQTPRTANGRYEGHGYVLVDAWWYLENLVYQVPWPELANPSDPGAGTTEKLYSHLVLNLTPLGTIITTKAQITDALQYAIDCEAPFQIGAIDLPDVYPPTSEVMDRMCAEVIHNQLRWTPDAVSYFDHATNPPTLHIKQRSALARVTKAISECLALQIRPRADLQVPAVVIKYRRTNLVNGLAYYEQALDVAPPGVTGREFRSIVSTIDLEGAQLNFSSAEIVCEAISKDDPNWWKGQHKPLGEESVEGLTVTGATRTSALPRELVSGTIPGWLLRKQLARAEKDTIRALASYNEMDGAKVNKKRLDRPVHIELTATDLETGSYLNSLSVSFGQPAPVGLANYLYLATSRLQFDGSFVLSENECAGAVGLGNVICLTGGRPEYAEMDAVVQSITESLDDGKTSVTFGPPKHLGADDIIEFLQATRNRVRFTPISAMTSGLAGGASSGAAPKDTPIKNTNADGGKVDKITVAEHIVLDRAHNPQNRGIQLREVDYCLNGVPKKMLVMASEVY